jgi:sec-independent protein translocase protein TatA
MPQGPELLIVLFVIVLLFGSTKLPKLARSVGRAQTEFKTGLREGGAEPAVDDDQSATA